jgi:hypothetical protein
MKFQIKVRNALQRRVPIYTDIALKRGQAVMADPADTTYLTDRPLGQGPKAKLGSDVAVLGLAIRDCTTVGATLEDALNPWPAGVNQTRGTAEAPDKYPGYTSLEPLPDELELEGELPGNASWPPDYLVTSGTGAIDTTTAVGAKVTYNAGKARITQSGETPQYTVRAQLTPETAGNVRVWLEKVNA